MRSIETKSTSQKKKVAVSTSSQEKVVSPEKRSTAKMILLITSVVLGFTAFWIQSSYISIPFHEWLKSIKMVHSSHSNVMEAHGRTPIDNHNVNGWLNRIVAVGDLHGDWNGTIEVLQMAGIINAEHKWIAGSDVLVQTGDIVDRGDATIPLYKLFQRLSKEANMTGGKVIQLLGNHEVMNVHGDWRYVTPGDIESFGGVDQRKQAFSSEGWLGKYIRSRNLTALVNGTVFFHGGAHPNWGALGVKNMNFHAKKALRSQDAGIREPLFGGDGPLWYRGYAQDAESEICHVLDKALILLGAKRMVVGHTPQLNGRILTRCSSKLHVIDVGISAAYGSHRAAIEIINDVVIPIYPKKSK